MLVLMAPAPLSVASIPLTKPQMASPTPTTARVSETSATRL
jgi:hypothetical protein